MSPTVPLEENVGLSVRCLKGVLVEDIKVDAGAYTYGVISKAGEEKWYRFLTGVAGSYSIQTYGTTDTYMYLYDNNQTTILAEDNDGAGSGSNSRIAQSLSADTWYYVKIRGFDNTVTGSYSIDVNALPAPPTASNVIRNLRWISRTQLGLQCRLMFLLFGMMLLPVVILPWLPQGLMLALMWPGPSL